MHPSPEFNYEPNNQVSLLKSTFQSEKSRLEEPDRTIQRSAAFTGSCPVGSIITSPGAQSWNVYWRKGEERKMDDGVPELAAMSAA